MKIQFFILSATIIMVSCNTKPEPQSDDSNRAADSLRMAADTSGLAQFQAMKAQNELGMKNPDGKEEKSTSKTEKGRTGTKSGSETSSTSNSNSNSNDASSSGSSQKKGWSKTAKGAVIGGVVGAGTGAVVNKKNRAAGAVIGGVIGAGAGAVIGNDMDKKTGRH